VRPGKCECAGCLLVFTSISAFDMHRVGGYGEPIYKRLASGKQNEIIGYTQPTRGCATIPEMITRGMVQTSKGWWATGQFHYEREEKVST